ncbi:acyl-CoA synthetase (AMP-forming)/AMP-acid ligase II [Microterricola gilva]|uniref:Acyl-CoA synthetase (AMP-forming)/AMP-acid ligase II n=1 Tax=Microterricola gilva TaxID=393267 RepID=A0A4Q8AKQ3_9MICO|nr:AMP-binding protein [Microterricola gilva]RZU64621.1 acyl-CoA synthetase (AMP-forming)/AMP-acid ligase II [Microterricola gilva]
MSSPLLSDTSAGTARWLGGADADTALRFGGRALSYGALRERVARHDVARSNPTPGVVVRADSADDTELLVTVLAALDRGRPVMIGDARDPAPLPQHVPASAGLIVMTSGSSGRARAIARTAASWHDSFAPFAAATGLGRGDTVVLTGPLHVSMHLFAALHTLWLGAELSDDPTAASAVHCTPAVLRRILSAERLPQRIIVAGAALPEAGRAAAEQRGSTVTEYYGAAELSFVAIGDRAGALRAFPGVELELRGGEDGGERSAWVRSPYLSLGYVGSANGALLRDDSGFASVGDLIDLGDDGTVRVRGRADAAVTTAGSTVLSEDIERAIEGIPGVGTAAVLAEPHPILGESVLAVLERTAALDGAGALDAVVASARGLFTPIERPRRWLLVDAIPRTASGKLAKGVLRAGLDDGTIPFSEFGAPRDV